MKAGQVVALYPNDFEYVQVLPVIVQIFVRQSPVDNILIFGQTVTDNLKQNVDIRLVSDSMDNFLSDRVAYQRITYNYENEKTMKVLNISTIQKGELFELVYVAEPECFDEYLPAVNSMIESFKITR